MKVRVKVKFQYLWTKLGEYVVKINKFNSTKFFRENGATMKVEFFQKNKYVLLKKRHLLDYDLMPPHLSTFCSV